MIIEFISERPVPRQIEAAIFDFDGTLSLLRQNWQGIMIPMMVEVLAATNSGETTAELESVVDDFVTRLTGRQTIYQMMQLVEEVEQRGGRPLAPLEYKQEYHDRLWAEVCHRVEAVRTGVTPAAEMCVAGSESLLEELSSVGVSLFLASGTDLDYVRDELNVLGLAPFFGEHVYGALDDYQNFSKAMIIARILESVNEGERLIGFGDGFVEIEEVRKVGGYAIAVASNEDGTPGVNDWKRQRLIEAGADIVIADYRQLDELLQHLELR